MEKATPIRTSPERTSLETAFSTDAATMSAKSLVETEGLCFKERASASE